MKRYGHFPPCFTLTFKVHQFLLFAMDAITTLQYSNRRQLYTNKTERQHRSQRRDSHFRCLKSKPHSGNLRGNKSILNLSSPNILLSDKIFSFLSLSCYASRPTQEYSERHTYKNMAYAFMIIILLEASAATSSMVIYVLQACHDSQSLGHLCSSQHLFSSQHQLEFILIKQKVPYKWLVRIHSAQS